MGGGGRDGKTSARSEFDGGPSLMPRLTIPLLYPELVRGSLSNTPLSKATKQNNSCQVCRPDSRLRIVDTPI
jgi:hypothetical protein